MDWSTLAPTVVGGILALGGGFLGQTWGERRAQAREKRHWAREDELRTFDQRRDAYMQLLNATGNALGRVSSLLPNAQDAFAALLGDLNVAHRLVEVYGTPRVRASGLAAYDATVRWAMHEASLAGAPPGQGNHVQYVLVEQLNEVMQDAHSDLVEAVRADLGIPSSEPS